MFAPQKDMLAVFSHPNHEVAVYGILRQSKPQVAFLTDGGGGERLSESGTGLSAAGVYRVSCLNHSENSFYQAVLDKDVAFFRSVARQVADIIVSSSPSRILCDAVEYYNPIHDMALPIVLLATKLAKFEAPITAIPLVYQGDGAPESYVFQRSLPGQRSLEEAFELDEDARLAKSEILVSVYHQLMAQMKFPPEVLEQACRTEHVVPAPSPLVPPDPSCIIRYDRRGEEAHKAGAVTRAITYEGHFLPLVLEMLDG